MRTKRLICKYEIIANRTFHQVFALNLKTFLLFRDLFAETSEMKDGVYTGKTYGQIDSKKPKASTSGFTDKSGPK